MLPFVPRCPVRFLLIAVSAVIIPVIGAIKAVVRIAVIAVAATVRGEIVAIAVAPASSPAEYIAQRLTAGFVGTIIPWAVIVIVISLIVVTGIKIPTTVRIIVVNVAEWSVIVLLAPIIAGMVAIVLVAVHVVPSVLRVSAVVAVVVVVRRTTATVITAATVIGV